MKPALGLSAALFLIPCLSHPQLASLAAEEEEQNFTPLWDVTWKDDDQWVEAVSRRPTLIKNAPQSVVFLNEDDLHNTPAYDIAQRLRYEAGIDVYQTRAGQIDIGIRGFAGLNSPRTVALIDGRDFNFDLFGTPMWVGVLHPTDIIRAEIVKGPSSVAYGANAFGGVISLKDRDVGDFTELHTLAQMGTDGLYEIDATAMGPLGHYNGPGPLYFKISAGATQREDLDGLRGLEPGTPFPRAVQNDEDSMVSNRVSFLLGTKLNHDHQMELEFYRLNIQSWDMIEDLAVGSNDMDIEQETVGLRLMGPWGEARYLHTYTNEFYSNSITTYSPTSDYRYTQGDIESRQDQFRFQMTKEIQPKHFLSFGYDYLRWESLSNFWDKDALVNDPNTFATVITRNNAVFIEDQWEKNNWTFTSAIRVDDHNIIGTNISPRLATNYQISDDQFLRLSYSQGYRLPAPLEGYLDQYFYAISEDLDEETIRSLNAGWQIDLNETDRLSVDVFFNRAYDTPFFTPLPEDQMETNWNDWVTNYLLMGDYSRAPGPFFVYENIDNPATVFGVELSSEFVFQHSPNSAITTWANMTYQDFSFKNDIIYQSNGYPDASLPSGTAFQFNQNLGDDINGPPPWKVSLGAHWDYNAWRLSGAVRYVDSREVFAFASSQWRTRDLASRETLDDYAAFDLALEYNWGKATNRRQLIKLSVLDLFDNEHTEYYEVKVDELIDSGENQHTNQIGRSIVATLQWEF